MKTTELVESIVRETVENMGYELCDVEFQKEFGNWVLTLFINNDGGVNIDDCEQVSKAVDPILDEADPIEQQYYLSVSSLGLDRPLKKDGDFRRNMGNAITVKLYAPLNGKKEYEGVLSAFDEKTLTLTAGETETVINRKDAASIKPVIQF